MLATAIAANFLNVDINSLFSDKIKAMTFFACRYACAYSTIKKKDWWDTSICGGPIVEQATHFIDLMRYFAGEIAEESIKAVAVGPTLPLSDMAAAPEAEHTVRHG